MTSEEKISKNFLEIRIEQRAENSLRKLKQETDKMIWGNKYLSKLNIIIGGQKIRFATYVMNAIKVPSAHMKEFDATEVDKELLEESKREQTDSILNQLAYIKDFIDERNDNEI